MINKKEDSIFKENIKKLMVFTDFDGTITVKDLGDDLFIKHGKFEPYHTELLNKTLTIKEYWKKLCGSLPADLDENAIREYTLKQEIDPYFKEFALYCRKHEIPLAIVSDGFDVYINPLLEREGLEGIPVYSNKMLFKGDEKIPYYPGASDSCECFCASCKRNSVINHVPEDKIIAFIGDGYSDFCVAEHSDIVFAKKSLAAYCNENKIPHYPFNTFFDVKALLNKHLRKSRIKSRRQAEIKRKKAFETE